MKVSRILVVDDDQAVLQMFSQLLVKEGYEVWQSSRGHDGLRMARERRPDLVLLDVMLPDLGGVELCRQIKNDPALADVFVVLISGAATRGAEKAAGLESGADEYMLKRIDRDEFLARVRTLLRLRETTVALRAREQHYRQLLEILPDAVALIDLEGRLTGINPQLCALLGYNKSEDLLEKSVFDLT